MQKLEEKLARLERRHASDKWTISHLRKTIRKSRYKPLTLYTAKELQQQQQQQKKKAPIDDPIEDPDEDVIPPTQPLDEEKEEEEVIPPTQALNPLYELLQCNQCKTKKA